MRNFEAVVIGAGSSGTLSAISAGRLGLKTCLIERGNRIGGVPVNTLMGSFANLFFDDEGNVYASNIVAELIERIINKGGTVFKSLAELMDTEELYQITIPYQPEVYESVLTEMLFEAGVEVILNAEIHSVEVVDDVIRSLTFSSNGNSETITSKVFTDATGNAFIATMSGAETYHKNSSYGCLMRLGGVDIEKTLEHIEKTRQWRDIPGYNEWLESKLVNKVYKGTGSILRSPVTYDHAPMMTKEDFLMNDEKWKYITDRWKKYGFIYTLEVSLFREELRKACDNGDFIFEMFFNKEKGVTFNGDGISYGAWGENIALINVAKAFGFNPNNVDDETMANIYSRQYNVMFANVLKKYVPGFENSYLIDHGGRAANRSCTHVDNTSYTEELYGTPIYTFKTMYHFQKAKQIPYRAILGNKIKNLLVVGKGAYQSESFRSQISCMLMGISATAVAKTILDGNVDTHHIDPKELEKNLELLFEWK